MGHVIPISPKLIRFGEMGQDVSISPNSINFMKTQQVFGEVRQGIPISPQGPIHALRHSAKRIGTDNIFTFRRKVFGAF
jgi:hypothetical protein